MSKAYDPRGFDWQSFISQAISPPDARTRDNWSKHPWGSYSHPSEDRDNTYTPATDGKKGEGAGPGPGKNGYAGPDRPNYSAPNPNRAGYAGNRVGAVGAYPGIPRGRAAKVVKGQMRELLRGLRQERKQVRNNQANDVRDINQFTDQTTSGLNNIQAQVLAYMNAQQGAINAQSARTSQAVGANDAALQGQIGATNTAEQQAAMAEMTRLGIQGTGIDQGWQQAQASQLAAAQQAAANNQNNIALESSMSNDINALMGSLAVGTFQNKRGEALIARQSALNEVGDDSRGQISDILAEMRSARKGKGDAINELLEQMLAGDYDRWANTTDMSFQHNMANRQFGNQLQQQRLALLQNAAQAQTEAGGWQAAFQGNPFGNVFGGPKGKKGKGRKPKKGASPTAGGYSPGNPDVYKGPVW